MGTSKIKIVIIGLLSLFSCVKNKVKEVSRSTYLYEILDKDLKNKGFIKRKSIVLGAKRTDTVFMLSPEKKHLDTIVENYIIEKNGLKNKETKTYFINIRKKDSCYQYLDLGEKYELCFLGKDNLIIKGKTYNDVYKYVITQMEEDGVKRHLYFNSDFILLKDVYKEGYAPYFDIVIIDKECIPPAPARILSSGGNE